MERIRKFFREEEGQTLVEYGVLLACLALVAVAGMYLLFESVATVYSNWGAWEGWSAGPGDYGS